jgi:hypothetical protein
MHHVRENTIGADRAMRAGATHLRTGDLAADRDHSDEGTFVTRTTESPRGVRAAEDSLQFVFLRKNVKPLIHHRPPPPPG